MFGLKTVLVLAHKRYLWRKRNADNGTSLGRFVIGTDNITVGRGSYGPISVLTSESNPHVSIGAYCSIAEGVTFVTGDDHPLNTFSTYPFKVMTLGDSNPEAISKGGIEIDDDVWIGFGATILDGVHIHRGGGCRGWCCRYKRRGTLHCRWWRAGKTTTNSIRARYDQRASCV